MKPPSFIYKYSATLLLILLPSIIFASEIRLDADKKEVRTGEEFIVSAILHTDEMVNAIEGEILFKEDLLELKEIYDGNSVINFWIENPSNKDGTISFSGITPGNFTGANQLILSFLFTAQKEGFADLDFKNINILRADGSGDKIDLNFYPAKILIKEGDSAIRKEKIVDKEPPEDFRAHISRNENLFNNEYFIVFSTQDKNSGMNFYEIKEGKFKFYSRAESPYLLKDQNLHSNIYIKAVDKAGNKREIVYLAENGNLWWNDYAYFVIILGIISFGFLAFVLWSKSQK